MAETKPSKLAREIAGIRTKLGFSQQQASDKLMVVQSTWSKWESGAIVPSKARLAAIRKLKK